MKMVRWLGRAALMMALLGWVGLLPGAAAGAAKTLEGVVNINAASSVQLQLLPGIGPAKAELILAYRRLRPFRTIEELARVKGIGPKTVRRLRPHLSVRGETTARVSGAPARVSGAPAPVPGAPAPAPAAATAAAAHGGKREAR